MASGIEDVYDEAARVAYLAVRGRTDRAQINRLLEIFNAAPGLESLRLVAAFAIRQSRRRELPVNAAKRISSFMRKLVEAGGQEEASIREMGRKFLGLLRWLFDAAYNLPLPSVRIEDLTFERFLELVSGRLG